MGQKRLVTAQQRKAAQGIASGMPIRHALVAAGYSDNVARHGRAALSATVMSLIPKESKQLMELGKITAEDQETLVRGRLAWNTIQGKDSGAQSAKILGSERRLNMWVPDQQTGVIVVTQPKDTVSATLDGDE